MKNKNHPDERVVYLALKNVFKGTNAEIRQLKAIRKLVKKSTNDADVADLIEAYNEDIICNIARTLLIDEIFASTLKAKIRFPEVFDVSPAQGAEREASEAEAAINEANAIKGAVLCYSGNVQVDFSSIEVAEAVEAAAIAEIVKSESATTCHNPEAGGEAPIGRNTQVVSSLFPVFFPLRTQYRILTKVQGILEDACFDFAQRAMPEILERRNWHCSEAAELNLWTHEFITLEKKFSEKVGGAAKPIIKLISSLTNIRHTAVHRVCIHAKGLEKLLLDAESFASLLGDKTRGKLLTELRRNVQQSIDELERNKHVLGSKLAESLRRIAAQRAELDRIEAMAIADTIREDEEYLAFAGKNLEEVTLQSMSPAPAANANMNEDETGLKMDDGSNVDDIDSFEEFGALLRQD
ncbi:hypothetical protein GGS21DRAFT_531300 [Xylaria nigripes]|nr:hypothetical protein GGS21DRAFT_531300 [Xylaria nigripes]